MISHESLSDPTYRMLICYTLKSEIKQKTDCVCLYRNGSCLYTISKCKINSRKLQVNLEISSNTLEVCIGPSIGAGTGLAGPAIHSQPLLFEGVVTHIKFSKSQLN